MSERTAFPLVFKEGGGLVFFVEPDGQVRVLRINGDEKLDDALQQIGSFRVEHLVFVAREIEREVGHRLPDHFRL